MNAMNNPRAVPGTALTNFNHDPDIYMRSRT